MMFGLVLANILSLNGYFNTGLAYFPNQANLLGIIYHGVRLRLYIDIIF